MPSDDVALTGPGVVQRDSAPGRGPVAARPELLDADPGQLRRAPARGPAPRDAP